MPNKPTDITWDNPKDISVSDNTEVTWDKPEQGKTTYIGPVAIPGFLANIPSGVSNIAKGIGTALTHPLKTLEGVADNLNASDVAFRSAVGLPPKVMSDPEKQAQLESMAPDTLPGKIAEGIKDPLSVPGKVATFVNEKPVDALLTGMNLVGGYRGLFSKPKTAYQISKEIDNTIATGISKGIKPSVQGKGSAPLIKSYNRKAKEAIETIIDNKNTLEFTRDGEKVIGKTPTSIYELSEAIDQSKRSIWKQIDDMAKKAGEKSSYKNINVDTVAEELDKIATNKNIRTVDPALADYAEETAKRIRNNSIVTPSDLQEQLIHLNNKTKAYYNNPTPNVSATAIDALVANKYRDILDKFIETEMGSGYQEFRNKYGALKTMEKDVAHRAVVDARKNTKGLIDFTDIATADQLAKAVISFNPAYLGSALGMQVVKNYFKALNDPNKIVSKMFADVEKARGYKPKTLIPPSAIASSIMLQQGGE